MEQNHVIKPQKPSRLRPPQIRTVPVSEEVRDRTAVTSRTNILMRRSRSATDLHMMNRNKNMEGATFSNMTKPSSLRLPQNKRAKLQPLLEHAVNVPSTNTVTLPKIRSRRSKSVTDLQLIENKPKATSSAICKGQRIGLTAAVSKTAPKRKAEKPKDEVKPKIVKQAKIPDWDYKGRYNQLLEKYNVLKEEHKRHIDKIEELSIIEDTLNMLKMELEQSKQLLNKRTADNERLSVENESLRKENKILSTDYASLKTSNHQLREEHNELLNNYNKMKADYDKVSVKIEELQLNLTLGSKRIIELTDETIHLKKEVNNGELLRRKLHNTVQDLKGNIRVFCRIRPPIQSEEDCLQCMINSIDEKTIEIRRSRESISAISGKPADIKAEFTVDKIFDAKSTQMEIFEDLAQLVQSALDGYDVCVFAYGQTGSGKTYTMQGGESPETKGMIPRTVDLIFESIKNLRIAGWDYEISASFLEIYNENIRDLLNPNQTQNLEIRFNEGKGTTVTNLSIEKLNSAEELKNLMTIAQRTRAVATTDFNEHSSRSHAVTKIYLQGTNEDMKVSYTGSINLVDLAGSESAKTSSSERLTETKNINKSLSALESVMLALYNKEKHIPYRNSKLTYLLMSCLGGSSKTLMVVNITPFEECYTESIYSLRFAAKVKEVKMSAKRNKTNFVPASNNKS